MLGRMGSLSNHLMGGKCPPKGAGMKGQTKAAARMMDTKAFGCTDNPQSVPTLWVERPGQDLNLRGVTQRFSRPPPYRTRRPGQRRLQRTTFGISVPQNSDKNAYDGIGFRPMGCESSRRSCPHARNRK